MEKQFSKKYFEFSESLENLIHDKLWGEREEEIRRYFGDAQLIHRIIDYLDTIGGLKK